MKFCEDCVARLEVKCPSCGLEKAQAAKKSKAKKVKKFHEIDPVLAHIMRSKITGIDTILALIMSSKEDIDMDTLRKKTG